MSEVIVVALATVGGLTLLSVAAFFAWSAFQSAWLKRATLVRQETIRERNACFLGDSYWFSEHPPTSNLIARLANGMNVSKARELWRQEIAEATK